MDDPIPPWLVERWNDYLTQRKDPYRPPDDIFRGLFAGDLCPLQRARELSSMIQTIRRLVPKPEVLMEVGVDKGSTFYHWLRAFSTIRKAVGIEIRGTPLAEVFAKEFPHVEFLWLPASSYSPQTVAHVARFLRDDRIDVLFLDGDKSHFDTDFDCYWPLVSGRGIVMMHDVFDNGSPMQQAFLDRSARFGHRGVVIDTSECDDAKGLQLLNGQAPWAAMYPPNYLGWLRSWSHSSCGFGWMLADSYDQPPRQELLE